MSCQVGHTGRRFFTSRLNSDFDVWLEFHNDVNSSFSRISTEKVHETVSPKFFFLLSRHALVFLKFHSMQVWCICMEFYGCL